MSYILPERGSCCNYHPQAAWINLNCTRHYKDTYDYWLYNTRKFQLVFGFTRLLVYNSQHHKDTWPLDSVAVPIPPHRWNRKWVCQWHVGRVKNLTMWFALPSVQALTFMLFSSLYTITHAANDIDINVYAVFFSVHNHSCSQWCCKKRSHSKDVL